MVHELVVRLSSDTKGFVEMARDFLCVSSMFNDADIQIISYDPATNWEQSKNHTAQKITNVSQLKEYRPELGEVNPSELECVETEWKGFGSHLDRVNKINKEIEALEKEKEEHKEIMKLKISNL